MKKNIPLIGVILCVIALILTVPYNIKNGVWHGITGLISNIIMLLFVLYTIYKFSNAQKQKIPQGLISIN